MRRIIAFSLITLLALVLTGCTLQQPVVDSDNPEQVYEGVVRAVVESGTRYGAQSFQILEVELLQGEQKGDVVMADATEMSSGGVFTFSTGDRVVLYHLTGPASDEWVVVDAVRRPALYALALLFAVVVTAVGGVRGLSSMLGLAFSFIVLLYYMLPQLLSGANPIFTSIVASSVILLGTLYLAHGMNRKTTVAIASTAVSLVLTGVLGSFFIDLAWLSGYSEDAFLLQNSVQGIELNLTGLLLGGMIVGALGVLDDISISQVAIVFALREANSKLGWMELFKRAMGVGKEHIASLVNTLVMAYAGVSLPLLLLFTSFEVPFTTVINREIVAVEIVRTLVGSFGLVTAVPLTTALAAHVALRTPPEKLATGHESGHHHHHHH